MKKLLLLITFALLILGCSASSKLISDAAELEKAGLTEEASEKYIQALRLEADNVEAMVGLKKSAQKILDEKLKQFESLFKNKEYLRAHQAFESSYTYIKRILRSGVKLKIADHYKNTFKTNKYKLANQYYLQGKEYFNNSNWEMAIDRLNQIRKYFSDFKDSNQMIATATRTWNNERATKHYQSGNAYFNKALWQKALNEFKQVNNYVADFKDTQIKINTAQEKWNLQRAEQHYQKGQSCFARSDWQSALSEFQQSAAFVSNYKNTSRLIIKAKNNWNLAQAKAYYNQGMQLFNSGNFREALNKFEKCLDHKSDYINARAMKNKAFKNSVVHLGILPVKNKARHSGFEQDIYDDFASALIRKTSKFIKYYQADALNIWNHNSFVRQYSYENTGRLKAYAKQQNLNTLALVTVRKVNIQGNSFNKTPKQAYIPVAYRNKKGRKAIKGKKVTYYEHEGFNNVSISVQYKLLDVRTGKILGEDTFDFQDSDKVRYATYKGNYKELTDIDPTTGGSLLLTAYSSFSGNGMDKSLFRARQNLTPVQDLISGVCKKIGDKLASEIYYKLN